MYVCIKIILLSFFFGILYLRYIISPVKMLLYIYTYKCYVGDKENRTITIMQMIFLKGNVNLRQFNEMFVILQLCTRLHMKLSRYFDYQVLFFSLLHSGF